MLLFAVAVGTVGIRATRHPHIQVFVCFSVDGRNRKGADNFLRATFRGGGEGYKGGDRGEGGRAPVKKLEENQW